jgi:glyoxylase-like metal-dependent hydrolase (beta-lactamase superfamily II)
MPELKIVTVLVTSTKAMLEQEANCFLVGTAHESVLIDAGYDLEASAEAVEKAVQQSGLATPNRILFTHAHPDHAPGAKHLRHWQATAMCHPLEEHSIQKALSLPEDEKTAALQRLSHEDTLEIDGHPLVALHSPGHTRGHLCFWLPEQKILFSGDNVLGKGTSWIGAPEGNVRDYLHSLEQLEQLPVARIAPGHGHWIDEQPQERIAYLHRHRLEREAQILSLLRTQPRRQASTATLTEAIYQDTIPAYIVPFARLTVEAHLQKLEEDGKVRRLSGDWYEAR